MASNPHATTLASSEVASTTDDLNDYDVISDNDPRSLESSIADLESTSPGARSIREPPPASEALTLYETAAMSSSDVQAFVQRAVRATAGATSRACSIGHGDSERACRIYVDGIFDVVHTGTALQLRQVKLAFPSVNLLVGPFTDVHCRLHGISTALPHVERCELLRHIRWVDQVIRDAPVVIDEAFLSRHRIDYVAVEEGTSLDPSVIKARLAGYDLAKSLGKALTTRRTKNLMAPFHTYVRESMPTPAMPSRKNLDSPTPSESKVASDDAGNVTKHLGSLTVHSVAEDRDAPTPLILLDPSRVDYAISVAQEEDLDRSRGKILAAPGELLDEARVEYAVSTSPYLDLSRSDRVIPEPQEDAF